MVQELTILKENKEELSQQHKTLKAQFENQMSQQNEENT